MSDTAIQVEGLGKRYLIQHLRQRQREHRYTSLRDEVTQRVRNLFVTGRKPSQMVATRAPNSWIVMSII